MVFINREEELKGLENAYKSKKPQFFIIYGRRRVGKTELIKHFIKDKMHFYFLAKQQPMSLEFNRFKEKFSKKFNIYVAGNEWESFFSEVFKKIKKRMIIVIDEFPYWIIKEKGVVSEFQYLWDEILCKKNVFLIFLGSYISIMETNVLSYKSPLYGRRTGQIYVEGLKIKHLKDFFPHYNIEEIVKTYGALGAIPYYLIHFNPRMNFEENVLNTFLNNVHPLYQDAEILLRIELREPDIYFNIMKNILEGARKLNEIANKSKVDITNISKYLNTLIKLRLIKKIKPITSSPKEKNYLYVLEDNYFKFWLTYVYPYKEEIEENPEMHLEFIKKSYGDYLGNIFENFCRKAVNRIFSFTKIGKWWYKDKEIDIVGINEKSKEILFCECKWQNHVNGKKILKELEEKSREVKWESKKSHYIVFAKSFKKKNKLMFDLSDLDQLLHK